MEARGNDAGAAGPAAAGRDVRLELFVEHTPAIVAMFDREMRYVAASRRWREAFGLPDDVIGRSHYALMPPLPEHWLDAHRRALAGETIVCDDDSWQKPDGTTGHMRWETRPWPAADGSVGGILIAVDDLTAIRRATHEIAAREAELQTLVDAIPTLAWVARPDGWIYWYNRRWYEYTGTTPAQMEGWGWEAVHDPVYLPDVKARWRASLETGEPFEMTFPMRGADGTFRPFLTRIVPLKDAGGRVARWFGTNTDVTREREALARLAASEERLSIATEAADLGIHDFDVLTGRIRWDARIRELFGVGRDEPVTYETFKRGLYPDDLAATDAAVQRSLDPAGDGRYAGEYRVLRPDGSIRWVYATGRTFFENGRAVRLVGTAQDVTGRKRIELRLHDSDRRKDEFIATLSHELRNPLAPIRSAARLLASPQLTPDVLAWSRQVIDRQVRHMARLLDDLLDVARITRGKLDLKLERVPLAAVVDAALETARPAIDARRHTLVVEVPPGAPEIEGDPIRLAQVFSNLLTNAAKYTAPEGRIALRVAVDGRLLTASVRDNGMGIEPAALESVFEMFSQAGASSLSDGGLGIGLALVRGIVGLHGGTIVARSDGRDRGAEFVVELPIVCTTGTARAAAGEVFGVAARARRVLVADDSTDAADSLAMLLRAAGHTVAVARGGAEALRLAELERPDVAVLDLGMPGCDGYQVAAALRSTPWGAALRLAAVTGWGQHADRARALAAGFDVHMVKPVDPEALLRWIADARADVRSA